MKNRIDLLEQRRDRGWKGASRRRALGAIVTARAPDTRDMREITRCVICGRRLNDCRQHVDTCGERCFEQLLERQRKML